MRRLPVYLLIDTSGSMNGEPIAAVNAGLGVLMGALRQDPHALETVHLSLITFDADAKLIFPLTALDEVRIPEVTSPKSGPTHLGQALALLRGQCERELKRTQDDVKGDWAPQVFIMTDGKPSDKAVFEAESIAMRNAGFGQIVGCAAGPTAQQDDLRAICDHVVCLDTMDSQSFNSLFRWVSSAICGGSRSVGSGSRVVLPPPPPEIQLVT